MEYIDFIKSIEIKKIELCHLDVSKNEEFAHDLSEIHIGINHEVKKYEVKSNELKVYFEFDVIALSESVDFEEDVGINEDDIDCGDMLFNIEVIFNLTYAFKDVDNVEEFAKKNNNHINKFCEKNVPVNVWPYIREIVSSSTVRMGLSPLVIPAFKRI